MPAARPSGSWYYHQGGRPCGPVSAERLQELLSEGRVRPRQAVWRQSGPRLLFTHAATAAGGPGEDAPPPAPGPGPA
jgi:hypothetical protein